MSRIQTAIFTAVFITTSCTDVPQPKPQDNCTDVSCLPPVEEPPAESCQDEFTELSVAAEECLSCLGITRTACLDEFEDCSLSASCNAWKQCTEICVVNDSDLACYGTCDEVSEEFLTPLKMKTCACEICTAQCFNMCPL